MKSRALPIGVLVALASLLAACGGSSTGGDDAAPAPVAPTPTLSATPTSLQLVAGSGAPSAIAITNESSATAVTHIAADLAGTALENNVAQDASGCQTLAPGASCSLYFTPLNTAVSPTQIAIASDNGSPLAATIEIAMPNSAALSLAGSPLLLQGDFSAPASGQLTITNSSTVLTATNIRAILTGTALDGFLVQDATNCVSVAPGAQCTLTLTPDQSGAGIGSTAITIQGDNTAQIVANISINAAALLSIAVSPSSLSLFTNGPTESLTVTNTSLSPVHNVASHFNNTALAGLLTESGNTCSTLAASASCTLTFTPGSTSVAQTTATVSGTETIVVGVDFTIRDLQIGDAYQGGTVLRLPVGSTPGLVATAIAGGANWAVDVTTPVSALSLTDGLANSTLIDSTLSGASVARTCLNYSIVDNSTTYDNWYLPAIGELEDMLTAAANGSVSGFGGPRWSSTEMSATQAYIALINSGTIVSTFSAKGAALNILCSHTF